MERIIEIVDHGGPDGWHSYSFGEAREKVVRCKDCAHASELGDGTLDCHGPLTTPWDYYADQPQINVVEPGGFCAWAERKA